MTDDGTLYETTTNFGQYQVANTIYGGRRARILYSGNHLAAQSGLALDDKQELLFDYIERFMELVRGRSPQRVLIIGGGAFTLPSAIIKAFPNTYIDVVEPDAELEAIAKQYFEWQPTERCHTYITDGANYVQTVKARYDLIVIDAFIHAAVPESLASPEVAANLHQCLEPEGLVAMNIIAAYHGARAKPLQDQVRIFSKVFTRVSIFPAGSGLSEWLPQNFIVTAYDSGPNPTESLRYGPLAAGEGSL